MATKFVSSSGSGYLPPHMRNQASEPNKPDVLRMDDKNQFPGLKSTTIKKAEEAIKQKTNFWSGMVSFKETIVNLIEKEKKTEAERKADWEKEREKHAWASLPLKFDTERYIEFNEKMLGLHQKTAQVNNLIQQGIYAEANLDSDVVYNDSDVDCFSVSTDSYDENQANLDDDEKEDGEDYNSS